MSKLFKSPPRTLGTDEATRDSRLRGNDGRKKRVLIIGAVLVAMALAGCGKKGQPTPPPGVPNTYPQNYPAQ